MLGIIKRNFIHMDPQNIYYVIQSTSPSACRICKFCLVPLQKGDIEAIEKKSKKSHQTCDFPKKVTIYRTFAAFKLILLEI